MKNIICIDPSLICSCVIINDKKFIYTGNHIIFTQSEKPVLTKWFEKTKNLITFRNFEVQDYKNEKYSESEIIKIKKYDKITDEIITDIKNNIINGERINVFIEGYSFSSSYGPLVDLVTFGSLIRYKIINTFGENVNMKIIAPQELKKMAASLVYKIGKNGKIIDESGKSAGSFTKIDMAKCLLKLENRNDEWINFLHENEEEIFKNKKIPKPIEDVNDAKLMYEYFFNN